MIHVYPRNLRGIIAVALFLAAWFVWLMWVDSKPKKDYTAVTGSITFFSKQYKNFPIRDYGKYRYLKLDDYAYPFEMYFDYDTADHRFDKVESLKPGDIITIYYYETDDTREAGINRHLQYIDKDNVQIYKRGNVSQMLGTIMLGCCAGLIILGIELYKRKRIPY